MSNRKRRRISRARAMRQRQLLQRMLILIAVIAVVLCFIINRATKARNQEDTVSSKTENTVASETESIVASESESTVSEEKEGSDPAESESTVSAEAEDKETEGLSDSASSDSSEAVSESEASESTPIVTVTPQAAWLEETEEEKTELEREVDALNQTVAEAKERQALLNLNDDDLAAELREREVPEELIEFMQEYPETRDFVVGYLFQPETEPSMDITGEVTKGVIPHFLQWDSRWGYKMYGGSMMAVSACGPTAMSEVYSGLTGKTDMNPYEMAQWAENRGYHIMGSGTSWDMMASGATLLGLNVWPIKASESAIMETLRDGYPIIAAMAPGDFTYFGHFIVLVSVDADGNISIRDSNSNIRTQRTWTADELLWQINQMWAYSYEMYPE